MARIRTVKPEFWKHPVMARLGDFVQLLALATISCADDEGYFRADHSIIRGEAFPFRENSGEIRDGLCKLSEVGWIELSQHPEQGLMARIVNWEKHQVISHPSKSKLKVYFTSRESPEGSDKPPEAFRPEQGAGSREKNKDQGTDTEAAVERIWNLCPKPMAKPRTTRAIVDALIEETKVLGDAGAIALLETQTHRYKLLIEQYRGNPAVWEKVPASFNWFAQRRYNDLPETWIPVGVYSAKDYLSRPCDVAINHPQVNTWEMTPDDERSALADIVWRQNGKDLERVPEHMRAYLKGTAV
jgi:hypothetical protein